MSTDRRWSLVFWLGMGVCFASFVANVAAGPLRNSYFSADQLYIATLFADLTRWGGHLADWHLTPAPYFFPDMLLYSVAWQLTRTLPYSIEAAQYLTGILQLGLLVLAARALVQRTLPGSFRTGALIAPIWAAWVSLYLAGADPLVAPGLDFASHAGALLSTLAVFTLALRPSDAPHHIGTVAAVTLSFLTGASDALFVVSCSAVLAVTAAACSIVGRQRSAAPLLILRAWLAAAAGLAGMIASRRLGFAEAATIHGSWATALDDVQKLWADSDQFARNAVLCLGVAIGFAAFAWVRLRARADAAALRMLVCWQVAASLIVLGAIFYTGAYGDRASMRYFIVPFHLALVSLAACAAFCACTASTPRAVTLPTAMTVLSIIASVVAGVVALALAATSTLAAPQRGAAGCVRDIARREGVSAVLSNYWYAKPLMLLTDDGAHVIQVRNGLQPYLWINSRSWYRGPHELGVIITNEMNVPRIRKFLGEPQAVERCDNLELFVYRDAARAHMQTRVQSMFDRVVAGDAAR